MAVGEDVYCTLCMSDNYLPGAAVLAKSLRDTGTTKKLACLIDQERLQPSTVTELQSLYNYTIPIQRIGNPAPANLYLMNRPDLLYTFTKIHLWRLTQFRKIVYIDSDVVCLRAPDELFALETPFAAAPDVGWPDAFNTGVMALAPNMGDYYALHTLAEAGDSFDGADQGLLNQYFEHKDWTRLSFVYNCTPSANYQYEPAYRYYKRDIRMVHFIGREKPWQRDRSVTGVSGAFQELLGRWWAVYDRHFKVSTTEYIESGRREPVGRAVRQEVDRHQKPAEASYYATGYPVASTLPAPPPPSIATEDSSVSSTTEIPFTEPGEAAENIDQRYTEPQSTVEVRRFSAPLLEWDATRDRPPVDSKPEAANFPTQTYEFSTDPKPFVPPKAYPEPPKDLWYEVPKEKPREENLAPLFPWEERKGQPKPTRRFIGEEKVPHPIETTGGIGEDEFSVQSDSSKSSLLEPKTPTIRVNDTWSAFGASGKNAWDEVSGIEDYVRALTKFQKQRGKVQVLQPTAMNKSDPNELADPAPPAEISSPTPQPPPSRAGEPQTHILSPSNEMEPAALIEAVAKRRESLILTDFPSAVDRPSLPVTPAPRRRTTFWGSDGGEGRGEGEDGEGKWVRAEGVVEQGDWDPNVQLEQLRRNSLMGPGDLKLPGKKVIPDREMVTHHLESVGEAPAVKEVSALVFAEPDFAVAASKEEAGLEGALSPTEAAAS